MAKRFYNEFVSKFIEYVTAAGNLPSVGEFVFENGIDMRLWFNSMQVLRGQVPFVDGLFDSLDELGISLLGNKEKEEEFLSTIVDSGHIPLYHEMFFSDNSDMYSWYIGYRVEHEDFEKVVCKHLPEFESFDINEITDEDMWKAVKNYLQLSDNNLRHGKRYRDIDMVTIVFKLMREEPERFEKAFLDVRNKKNFISFDARMAQFIVACNLLGDKPILQGMRFTDGCDMYTWYNNLSPSNRDTVDRILSENEVFKKEKVYNLFIFPAGLDRANGGDVFIVCRSEEKLTIPDGISLEEALKKYPGLKKTGAVILPKGSKLGKIRDIK